MVMNGKKSELETRNGMNGIRKRPAKVIDLKAGLFMIKWNDVTRHIRRPDVFQAVLHRTLLLI